jgi:hypothetical protein
LGHSAAKGLALPGGHAKPGEHPKLQLAPSVP